jgi:Holliday junction resolvase RusA-like endonuclease
MQIRLNVIPMGRPRETRRDLWDPRTCVLKYRQQYKDTLRAELVKNNVKITSILPWIRFELPMPKSWTNKKRTLMLGKPHQENTPDLDNMIKAFLDCVFDTESKRSCNFSELKDDKQVHTFLGMEKVWSEEGAIVLIYGNSSDTDSIGGTNE